MFSYYNYLNANLFVSHLGFWSWNIILIMPVPDHKIVQVGNDQEMSQSERKSHSTNRGWEDYFFERNYLTPPLKSTAQVYNINRFP